ncbi:uncharacterized protein LOC122060157 [Macadamia integrifolia]|uniref:uncharacterized protein LOC122060157 n=1 Tax=Macadamia integrifolia TaxID=60698 RepID=UPI001C527D4F|nr:uncharacterized protein LOC122060157 [Macadamia integrifolia]
MSWSSSDNFYVNARLEVFSVDLLSEPLELTRSTGVVYDGPKGDDFLRFLRSKNFRVNRQGKAIVYVQKRNGDGEFLECLYDTFILETVVPLGPFGFQNVPLPKPQEVIELQSLLDSTKSELAKKNDVIKELESNLGNNKAELAKKNYALNELQSLLDNTKAELAKKNDALNELAKQKIDQDWTQEQFRLTMVAITNSMKRVFIGFGLEPPASGGPESVLRFLEMLCDLILHKECGATFLVAANEILASMANIFEKRTGLSIGMETTNSTPMTPACLIKSLSTLRVFMVDAHFFIDGNVIVRDLHLMNEEDLPVIFRDSKADVAELKQNKEMGTKSIDNINKKSIFYGYFNIPTIGIFKGVLTRVHVNLPDEIMVKLRAGGKHTLNDNRFWFVYANGAGIFESTDNLEIVKFAPSRVLGDRTNFLEFFLRMNRTFVNEKGTYLKFDFIASNPSILRDWPDNTVRYYDKDFIMHNPFKLVQFDVNECPTDTLQQEVSFPGASKATSGKYATWIVNEALGNNCAFQFKNFCFIGKITKEASGIFRKNALVSVFFEQNQHGENCYVDALATTFFVLKTEQLNSWINDRKKSVEFI